MPVRFRILLVFALTIGSFVTAQETQKNSTTSSSYNKAIKLFDAGKLKVEDKQYSDAIDAFKNSKSILDSIKDESLLPDVLYEIGNVHYSINDFTKALDYYLKSLEVTESQNDPIKTAKIKHVIGDLHLRLGQCNRAFEYLFSAQDLMKSSNVKKEDEQKILQSIGIAYGSCGDLDSAQFYFEQILNLVDQPYSGMFTGGVINNLGAIYSKKDANSEALLMYDDALKLFTKDSIDLGIAVTKGNIAYIYKKQKKYIDAIDLYNEAITLFKKENALVYLRDNYQNLSEVYELNGDFKKALEYNNYFLELNDSISNSEVIADMNNLQMQYEIKKKDQEVLIAQQKADLIESQSEVQRVWLLLIIGGVLLITVILFLAYRNNKVSLLNSELEQTVLKQEKRELNRKLNSKSKELEGFALSIVEKNQLLEQLKNQLADLSAEDAADVNQIKEITNTINNRLYIEKDKKEFELQLDETYQAFFSNLDKKYPDLTKNERRLSSLLALELSSKDIAIILNISSDGVKKSRYRLRKKLGLESDTDLSEFMKNI